MTKKSTPAIDVIGAGYILLAVIRKKIFVGLIILSLFSCNTQKKNDPAKPGMKTSIKEATPIAFEGKFIGIDKIDDKAYNLQLLADDDSIINFITLMPLDETQISLLKNIRNNIHLTYQEYYNPVKKRTDKMVISMIPIYKFYK